MYYLKQNGVNVKENWKSGRRELDIFLPAINVAIEYDGQHFHTNLEKDKAKNDYCKKKQHPFNTNSRAKTAEYQGVHLH